MVVVYTVIALTILLLTMFIHGYLKSKRTLANKEKTFRQELIELIYITQEKLTDEQKNQITTLPGRKLTTYLYDNDLIHHAAYNEIQKKHFDSD